LYSQYQKDLGKTAYLSEESIGNIVDHLYCTRWFMKDFEIKIGRTSDGLFVNRFGAVGKALIIQNFLRSKSRFKL
jgi:hypothetical protein